jgi:hypothetical protein
MKMSHCAITLLLCVTNIAAAPNPANNGCRDHGAGKGCRPVRTSGAPGQAGNGYTRGDPGRAGRSSSIADHWRILWIGGYRQPDLWYGVEDQRANEQADKNAKKDRAAVETQARLGREANRRQDQQAKNSLDSAKRDEKARREADSRRAKTDKDRADRDKAAKDRSNAEKAARQRGSR